MKPSLGLSEVTMESQIDHLVTSFGRDVVARRLPEHVGTAQSEAVAFGAAGSRALATLRRRDATILRAMRDELEHPSNRSGAARADVTLERAE